MDINSKLDILIKIYKKDLDTFETILKKFVCYPPGRIESLITKKMISNERPDAYIFKFKIDSISLSYFLKEVRPLLNDGMEDMIFYTTVKEVDTDLGQATLKKPKVVPTCSHGWIIMIGVKEIETVGQIDSLLEKTRENLLSTFGYGIFGLSGRIAEKRKK